MSKRLVDKAKDAKSKAESDADKQRIRELERQVELQQERIEELGRERWALPTSVRAADSGAFIRIVVPDSHGSHIDEAAAAAFLADLEALGASVREVVWIGDHIDCGGFLAQHHTWGYVAETEYCFADDVDATNCFLDRVQGFTPDADHHLLEGNHERRIERWCVTQALRSGNPKKEAMFLRQRFGVESVLHLEKRGVKHYRQGVCYGDCKIPSTIKLGHCYFTHGQRAGKHATAATLSDFGGNVVHGHTHRRKGDADWTVGGGEIGGWCPGFLAKIQPYWMHQKPSGWSHGYGLQLVRQDGGFLHINVPIIGGESYLVQMTERIGGK